MTAGFMLIMGVFFLWVAFTNRGRPLLEAITGMTWIDPHIQTGPDAPN